MQKDAVTIATEAKSSSRAVESNKLQSHMRALPDNCKDDNGNIQQFALRTVSKVMYKK